MLAVLGELRHPGVARAASALAQLLLEVLVHAVRHQEFRVLRPAVVALGQPDLFFAQRLAVRRAGVLLVRRAIRDVAVHDDQRRPVVGCLKRAERPRQHLQIVGVAHPQHIPAIAQKPRGHVFTERQRRVAFNGDVVVVVNPAEIGELQVSRQRRRFAADAFHHAAVARQRVDVEVDHLEARPVEMLRHPARCQRHSDAGRHALPQRTRGGFDAGRPAVLRMPGALAVELPEILDVVQRDAHRPERFVLRDSPPSPGSDAASNRAASTRGRTKAQSGRDSARWDRPDRTSGTAARACRPPAPWPSACRDARSWLVEPRPSTGCGWC